MPQDPTLIATCNAGVCEVVDLQAHSVTECGDPNDCRLRTHDCCECGGDQSMEGLIAINRSGESDFSALVCDSQMGCALCQPLPPANAIADCDMGRCRVVWAVP